METTIGEKDYIVIDNGSGFIKAGFSGEDTPRIVIPTVMETIPAPEQGKVIVYNIGNNIDLKNPVQERLTYPIERGQIINLEKEPDTNWDTMTRIWEYIIKTLGTEPSTANVLITDSPCSDRDTKLKMAEIMFDKLKVNTLGIVSTAVLSLLSTGRTRGLVVESGDGITHAVPVFEGYALPHAIRTLHLAGSDLTKHIHDSLREHLLPAQITIARNIKEQMLKVPTDYQSALHGRDLISEEAMSYELPGGKIIQVDQQTRVTAGEILFNPSLVDCRDDPIQRIALDAINKCDNDIKNDLYNNIVLVGGTSMTNGFVERMETEIYDNLPADIMRSEVNIIADPFRHHAAWIGGSMLASLDTYCQFLTITKAQWESESETRNSIVQRCSF